MSRFFKFDRLFVLAAGMFLASTTDAQERRRPPEPPANRETVRATGTVKGVQGQVLLIAGEEDKQWLLKMPERPEAFRVVGTALPNWLGRGMFVRFGGNFDRKGEAAEPIGKLTVFTPRLPTKPGDAGEPLGVFPEAALNAGNLFGDPAQPAAPAEVQAYQVAGQLSGIRDGKLFVAAGRAMVKVELAEDAEIVVDVTGMTGPQWLRIGDEVEFDGWAYPQQKTHVYGNRLTIHPAKPLGFVPEAEEKPPLGGAAKKPEKVSPF